MLVNLPPDAFGDRLARQTDILELSLASVLDSQFLVLQVYSGVCRNMSHHAGYSNYMKVLSVLLSAGKKLIDMQYCISCTVHLCLFTAMG